MANCLNCEHFKVYPKDLAIIRLSNNPFKQVRYKCLKTSPQIRTYSITAITSGTCPTFEQKRNNL